MEQMESPGRDQGRGRDPLLPVERQGDSAQPTCIPGGGGDVGRVMKSPLTLVGSTQLSHFSSFFRRTPPLNTHEREQKSLRTGRSSVKHTSPSPRLDRGPRHALPGRGFGLGEQSARSVAGWMVRWMWRWRICGLKI